MSTKERRASPPRRIGRPPRGSEGEATLRILAAATPIFLAQGFEATSIDAVAAAAGISKKTIYTRFVSKADLFEAMCVRFIEENVPGIEREAGVDGPVGERLHRIALAMLQVFMVPDVVAFHRVVTAEATRFPEFARTVHDFGQARVVPLVERCLEEGARRSEIVVDDVRFAADSFLNLTVRAPLLRATLGMERPEMTHVKRETLRRSVDFFLRGCRPQLVPTGETDLRSGTGVVAAVPP